MRYNATSGGDDNPVIFGTGVNGYERITQRYCGERCQMYHHQLLVIAMGEDPHKVFSGKYHCHHKNEIRWDNRPSNIELLTPKEHAKEHPERGSDVEYTDEELLSWINAFVSELGHVPTREEFAESPAPHPMTYKNRFGSWTHALNLAGWKRPNHSVDNQGRRVAYEEPQPVEEEVSQ
jgi:hypothetical protein